MSETVALTFPAISARALARAAVVFALFLIFQTTFYAQTQIAQPDEKTLVVDDAPEMEVYAIGKSVIVKGTAKGVLAFGGDVVIEGSVSGDVAAIGGSVIQKRDASVGGDVIVFGGSYKPESEAPLRTEGRETVVFGVFEDELREMAQNPSQIFSPAMSWSFLAQRLLSVLFWFIVTLGVATIAPGAVSRAIARIQLSTLKVIGIGFALFLLTSIGVISGFSFLPDYLSAALGLMAFVLLMLAYVFGRVALHVSFGKLLTKYIVPEGSRSETLAILAGVLVWTILMSIPYVWTFAVLALFSAGIGLVVTARNPNGWQKR